MRFERLAVSCILAVVGCAPADEGSAVSDVTDCGECGCPGEDLASPGAPFADLQFHNFEVTDERAARGLADIYDGAGFRNGIPERSLKLANQLGGVIENIKHPDHY